MIKEDSKKSTFRKGSLQDRSDPTTPVLSRVTNRSKTVSDNEANKALSPTDSPKITTRSKTLSEAHSPREMERTPSSTSLLSASSLTSSWKTFKSTLKRNKDSDDQDDNEDELKEETKEEIKEESTGKEYDFTEPDLPDLIFVKQEGTKLPIVKAGSTERLIDRLVPEKYPDPDYLGQFLLTYRSFTVPEKILDRLVEKYVRLTNICVTHWSGFKVSPLQMLPQIKLQSLTKIYLLFACGLPM